MASKNASAFDLASLDTATPCEEGAEIEIKHPVTGEGTGLLITVYGKDSETFRDYTKAKTNARLRQANLDARRGKQPPVSTVEEADAENADLLAHCVKSWRTRVGKEYEDTWMIAGEKLPCNKPNALKVFSDPRFRVVYDQVNEAIADLSNFIKV
jgi:hypothetical protein